ncbi:MAG: hypothetical protein MRY32_07055 [Rickettsiales bacterium]|nr:hypothetical protein [Rickettsiales bacterium]
MMIRMLSLAACAVMLGQLVISDGHAEFSLISEKTTPEGVTYISGGVGSEEQGMLATQKPNYNLQIRVALTTGHYVSEATMTIKDASGAIVIEDEIEGPFFYAKLAPGKYNVSAIMFDQTKNANVRIAKEGHRELVLRFKPSEFEDGLDQRGVE